MAIRELIIVRHGIAVEHGTPGYADDERPLTPKGERRMRQVARGLARLGVGADAILTSPLPRARRTAEIVADALGLAGVLEDRDELRADRSGTSILGWLDTRDEGRLMLVGHNPSLSDLVTLLATNRAVGRSIELAKGGVASFAGDEGMPLHLEWLATPKLLRRLRR